MKMLRFELRHPIRGGSYQHLALFGLHMPPGGPPLAHWILSNECTGIPELEHALLLTEADGTMLPDHVLDAGPVGLSAVTFPIQCSVCQLRLVLHGQHISGLFELQRLQPGGSLWLLEPVTVAAPKPQNITQAAGLSYRTSAA